LEPGLEGVHGDGGDMVAYAPDLGHYCWGGVSVGCSLVGYSTS
jgi:hypothetical protein